MFFTEWLAFEFAILTLIITLGAEEARCPECVLCMQQGQAQYSSTTGPLEAQSCDWTEKKKLR